MFPLYSHYRGAIIQENMFSLGNTNNKILPQVGGGGQGCPPPLVKNISTPGPGLRISEHRNSESFIFVGFIRV